jgi:LmbE family N-acetylglucosaminyl deacetylase
MKKTVVCFPAHSDDFEGGCAGTAMKMRDAGYEVHYVMLTANELAVEGTPKAQEIMETRWREGKAGAKAMGFEIEELNFKQFAHNYDSFERTPIDFRDYPPWDITRGSGIAPLVCATDMPEAIEMVAGVFREYEPEWAFTQSTYQCSIEHYASCLLVTRGFDRASKDVKLGSLLCWVSDPPRGEFRYPPDLVVDITDYAERKYEAIRCHVSQGMGQRKWPGRRTTLFGAMNGGGHTEVFRYLRRADSPGLYLDPGLGSRI